MKSILTLFIVGALSVTGRASTDAVLRGIRIVETQDQLHPPRGKLGERGPYQFRRNTWRMHTSSSFALAENREVANTIAKRHYAWIEAQLQSNGVEASPYNVAVAWNAGVNSVIRGNAPAVAHDYANRVLNLAASYERQEPAPETHTELAATTTTLLPNLFLDPVTAEAAPNQPVAVAVAPESPITVLEDSVNVRYYSDPIMLALNRTTPAEEAKAEEVVSHERVFPGTLAMLLTP